MRRLLALCAVLVLGAVVLLPLLAMWRGRESRVWTFVSRARPPFLTRGPTTPPPVQLPFRRGLSEVPDGWRWFHSELAVEVPDTEVLTLRSATESVWFHNRRGPMIWIPVTGDLDVTLRVRTRKASVPTEYPDSAWQFGGMILRDPAGDAAFSRENHVFNVVGYRGKGLQVEVKSTRDGESRVRGFDWESGDADLRMVRRGPAVELFRRPIGESEWEKLIDYDRPDLPDVVQFGLILYSYDYGGGRFDLEVGFESVEITQPPD